MTDFAPSAEQRAEIVDALSQIVKVKFYDPELCGLDWPAIVARHRNQIIAADDMESFEESVMKLLGELKSSHIGFYHASLKRASSKTAISAAYSSFPVEGEAYWVFQDVHEGGPAEEAGIRPGHTLLSVDGQVVRPPTHPTFTAGRAVEIVVRGRLNQATKHIVQVPPIVDVLHRLAPFKWRNQLPHARPKLVVRKRLNHDTGYVRVSMYPGLLGIEVANEVSSAVSSLRPLNRLILDLRGNTGGGLAVLRVMSLLTPTMLRVGYYLSRSQSEEIAHEERFLIFNRIPERKIEIPYLACKYLLIAGIMKQIGRDQSIMLATQGLGYQPFHGRVVILVDRHTASANEMLIAFVKENQLATLVGEPTAGRLLSGSKFKLPYDYRVALPVGVYRTARGTVLEGHPIEPDVAAAFEPEAALEGRDTQLERAVDVVSKM